tara:strand:+ start:208753 stop:209445 length:693 start_codon:yes stop_codon:yes gene_type:complete
MENFDLNYSLKKTKRKTLGIEVNHQGEVIVTAPDYIPQSKIDEVLAKRMKWIQEKVAEKKNNLNTQPKRNYVSGEALYLFGRQYYLKVIETNYENVEIDHNRITFYIREGESAKRVISEYLLNEFKAMIFHMADECLETFSKKYSISTKPKFKVRKMAKRWGSCTKDGIINLNPMLVAASVECIEYVIFHELTHLLHDDHDDEFFRTLKSVCPKFKELKERLEKETVLFE